MKFQVSSFEYPGEERNLRMHERLLRFRLGTVRHDITLQCNTHQQQTSVLRNTSILKLSLVSTHLRGMSEFDKFLPHFLYRVKLLNATAKSRKTSFVYNKKGMYENQKLTMKLPKASKLF